MKQLVSGKTETGYERFPSIIYRMVKIYERDCLFPKQSRSRRNLTESEPEGPCLDWFSCDSASDGVTLLLRATTPRIVVSLVNIRDIMEYPDYDYGTQQWNVDKVKLEFKTGIKQKKRDFRIHFFTLGIKSCSCCN